MERYTFVADERNVKSILEYIVYTQNIETENVQMNRENIEKTEIWKSQISLNLQ